MELSAQSATAAHAKVSTYLAAMHGVSTKDHSDTYPITVESTDA